MAQWYFSYDGNQIGPLDPVRAAAQARENPNGHVWRDGFAEWLPIGEVDELTRPGGPVPPPPLATARRGADEIDFKIFGAEMQFVEIELDPGESALPRPAP